MSKSLVPPAPQPSFSAARDKQSGVAADVASKSKSPLDAAFLGRIYRSILWFGTLMMVLSAPLFGYPAGVLSFAGGVGLAALLLRSQEILVRAALRPQEKIVTLDPRLAMVLALPIKVMIVAAGLGVLYRFELLSIGALAAGFFAGQAVILAKIAGWWLVRRAKSE